MTNTIVNLLIAIGYGISVYCLIILLTYAVTHLSMIFYTLAVNLRNKLGSIL